MLESTADKHDSVLTIPFWSNTSKTKKLHVNQQASCPKIWEDYLVQNYTQFFWGFSSLHTSLCLSLFMSWVTIPQYLFLKESQMPPQTKNTQFIHPLPPSSPEVQHQSFSQTMPELQPLISLRSDHRPTLNLHSQY